MKEHVVTYFDNETKERKKNVPILTMLQDVVKSFMYEKQNK